MAPPTGPVFLSLPGDILKHEADIDLMGPTRVAPHTRGDRAAIEAAAKILSEAKRPVIMAGDAVSQSRALAELVALAELIGAPVYAELIPNTASFPSSHPLFRGAMARSQTAMRKIFDQHDVLFSVGADLFALSLPSDTAPISSDLRMIHLDTDPWELGKNYPAEVAILGDPKGTLPELTEAIRADMPAAAQSAAKDRLQERERGDQGRAGEAESAREVARERNAGAAARADPCDRRNPAEGHRGGRRDRVVRRRPASAGAAATMRKASSACAAAASAGACRPRSA